MNGRGAEGGIYTLAEPNKKMESGVSIWKNPTLSSSILSRSGREGVFIIAMKNPPTKCPFLPAVRFYPPKIGGE